MDPRVEGTSPKQSPGHGPCCTTTTCMFLTNILPKNLFARVPLLFSQIPLFPDQPPRPVLLLERRSQQTPGFPASPHTTGPLPRSSSPAPSPIDHRHELESTAGVLEPSGSVVPYLGAGDFSAGRFGAQGRPETRSAQIHPGTLWGHSNLGLPRWPARINSDVT